MRATRSTAARARFSPTPSPRASQRRFSMQRLHTRASQCASPRSRCGVAAQLLPETGKFAREHTADRFISYRSVQRRAPRPESAASQALEPDAEATREMERATLAAARVPLVATKDTKPDATPAVSLACSSLSFPRHAFATDSRTPIQTSHVFSSRIPQSAASSAAARHAGHADVSAGSAFRVAPSPGSARHTSSASLLASFPPHHFSINTLTSWGDMTLMHAPNACLAFRVVASSAARDDSAARSANGHACAAP